jgi:hypothetical protein
MNNFIYKNKSLLLKIKRALKFERSANQKVQRALICIFSQRKRFGLNENEPNIFKRSAKYFEKSNIIVQ